MITKKVEDKISIYIIYGVADFKRNFFYSYNGISLIGINSGNEYFSSISSGSKDFPDPSDETNFYHFFNL
ncbi:MAG: hypothetical protein MJ252_09960, partial [archaeon]|nr:hypothetical protein [archaeon]